MATYLLLKNYYHIINVGLQHIKLIKIGSFSKFKEPGLFFSFSFIFSESKQGLEICSIQNQITNIYIYIYIYGRDMALEAEAQLYSNNIS